MAVARRASKTTARALAAGAENAARGARLPHSGGAGPAARRQRRGRLSSSHEIKLPWRTKRLGRSPSTAPR